MQCIQVPDQKRTWFLLWGRIKWWQKRTTRHPISKGNISEKGMGHVSVDSQAWTDVTSWICLFSDSGEVWPIKEAIWNIRQQTGEQYLSLSSSNYLLLMLLLDWKRKKKREWGGNMERMKVVEQRRAEEQMLGNGGSICHWVLRCEEGPALLWRFIRPHIFSWILKSYSIRASARLELMF